MRKQASIPKLKDRRKKRLKRRQSTNSKRNLEQRPIAHQQKKKPNEEAAQTDSLRQKTAVRVAGILTLVGALGVGHSAISKKESTQGDRTHITESATGSASIELGPIQSSSVFNNAEFADGALPEYEMIPGVETLNMPPEYTGTLDEFKRDAQQFSELVLGSMKNKLEPAIASTSEDQRKEIIHNYIISLINGLANISPHALHDVRALNASGRSQQIEEIATQLNYYLVPNDLVLLLLTSPSSYKLGIHEIKETSFVKMSDGVTTNTFPMHRIENGIGPQSIEPKSGYVATGEQRLNYAIFNSSLSDNYFDSIIRHQLHHSPTENKEKLHEEMLSDMIRHEVGHLFLAKKYPKAANELRIGVTYPLEINVTPPVGNPYPLFVGMNIPPIMLQELACVGLQGVNTKGTPYVLPLYLNRIEPAGHTYYLVGILGSVLAIDAAPDSPLKQQLLDQALRGTINPNKVMELISMQNFAPAHHKLVAERMYRIGTKQLEKIEKLQ